MNMQVIWLSMIQGLTEFLPVSSSGHLILFGKFSNFGDQGQIIDIALHVGSLFAILIYFFSTIQDMIIGLYKNKLKPNFDDFGVRLSYFVVIATIPAIVIGGMLKFFGMDWARNIELIAYLLIIFGILLWYADKYKSTDKSLSDMKLKDAIIIGFAQCMAFIPGTSRSGITITFGRFLGFKRSDVAKFSMLLSIPSILAAGVLAFIEFQNSAELIGDLSISATIIFSFIFSFIAIYLMMKWLRYKTFLPFVIYRIIVGLILLFYVYGG